MKKHLVKLTLEREIAEKIVAAVEQLQGKSIRLHLIVGRGGRVQQPMDVLAEWVRRDLISICRGALVSWLHHMPKCPAEPVKGRPRLGLDACTCGLAAVLLGAK